MARIVIFTYDSRIDRRVVLEIRTLESLGHEVITYARACLPEEETPGLSVRRLNISSMQVPGAVFGLRNLMQRHLPRLFTLLLPVLRPLGWLVLGANPSGAYLALFRQALAEQLPADIYIAHDLPMLPVACAAAQMHGGKIVYDSHEFFAEQEFRRFERYMWRQLEARYIPRADLVITINPSIAAALKERYHLGSVAVVQNAEWLPDPLPAPQKLFHKIFDLPPAARILLFQGTLGTGRNLEALVGAMAFVRSPDVHLVMLGDGDMKSGLLKRAQASPVAARIHFHPTVPQADLLAYSMAADAGVIPYQPTCLNNYFCTPNKLFEFIIAGLPIVATDLPELRRLVEGHGIGLVGDTSTAAALAALIDRLLQPEILAQARAAAQQTRTHLNWQTEQQHYMELIQNLLAGHA